MRNWRFWALLFSLLYLRLDISLAQQVSAIIKIAENHYKNESYFKAASFYLKALDQQPGNITALYKLAQSYRNITNYHSAEYYYEQVIQKSDERYPLSLYYYALTQKFNGKYEEALNNFQSFIANVQAGRYQRLRSNEADVFSEQARIEREGCLLALKELSKPIQENQFQILSEPVNSVSNDYAPYIFGHDSIIVVTSSRSESKGGNFDDKFGESLSDVFRYQLRNSRWVNAPDADRFTRMVNSKFHDGSGVFNKDFTSFYYTHCDESGCKIYVTKEINGKWVEAVPLNNNINPPRSDSRHPSLTPNGDTLFFVSNRQGTIGGNDIWMSIAARENSWGPAKNLGDHINTAFDEVSPFFDSKEKALFFSSRGHKGHGGLDIFMAEKIFDPRTELYNMGLPYNSSRDDAFFILGEHIGFLASNREGGLGKFDIYSFLIESDEEIIAEILNFKEVASRNSLFSSDYEFENTDTDKIEEIISHNLASRLHGIDMSLTQDELAFYNNLSEADRSRIERIVNTRLKAISSSNIIAVRHEDEFFYQQLNSDFKYHVDKMVTLYLEDYEVAPAVAIAQEDKDFYESLNVNTKEKVDRYIALKLDEYEDLDLNDQYYTSLDNQSKSIVDDISVNYLKNKSNLSDLSLSNEDLNFLNGLDAGTRAQTELSIANQVASISSLPEFDLGDGEQIFYRNLSGDEKSSLDNIAQAYIEASVDNLENFLNPADLSVYNNLTPVQKESFDKILAKRIQNFIKADKYTLDVLDERDLQRMTELQLSGDGDIFSILQDEGIADDSQLKQLAEEDSERFSRLLSSASNLVMMNTSSKLKEVALSVERGQDIESMIDDNENEISSSLSPDEQALVAGLSPDEKALFDQLLAQQLTEYVDSSESFIGNNYAQNPNLIPGLEQRLNRDFDAQSLLAKGNNDYLNEIAATMPSDRLNLMNGALASAAKGLIVNNTPEFQEMANRNALSPQFIAQINTAADPDLQLASRPQVATTNANNPSLSTSSVGAGAFMSLPVASVVQSAKPGFVSDLPPNQQEVYNNLSPEDKRFIDQALTVKMQEYVDNNDQVLSINANLPPDQAIALEDKLAEDFTITNLKQQGSINVSRSIESKPGNEQFILSGILTSAAKSILTNNGAQLQNLTTGSSAIAGSSLDPSSVNQSYRSLPTASIVQNSKSLVESNLSGDELATYNALSPADKEFVDLALTTQLNNYVNSNDNVLNYDQATAPEADTFENQLSRDFDLARLEADPNFQVTNSIRNKSPAEKDLISGVLANAGNTIINSNGPQLRSLSNTPSSLAETGGQSINQSYRTLPTAPIVQNSRSIVQNSLTGSQLSTYNSLSPNDKEFIDQVLTTQLNSYVNTGNDVLNINGASAQQAADIESQLIYDFNLNRIESNPSIQTTNSIRNKTPQEKNAISGLLASAGRTIISNNAAQLKGLASSSSFIIPSGSNSPSANSSLSSPNASGNSLSTKPVNSGAPPIARMVENSRTTYRRGFDSPQSSIYQNLSVEEKHFVDEALSSVISSYVDSNSRVIDLVKSQDPQDQEILNAKLASDFSINKLATNSLTPPPSLGNRPPSFRSGLSNTMANMAKSVLASNNSELRNLAGTPPGATAVAINSSPTNVEIGNLTSSQTPAVNATPANIQSSIASNPAVIPYSNSGEALSTASGNIEGVLKANYLTTYQGFSEPKKLLLQDIMQEKLIEIYQENPQTFNAFASRNDRAVQNGLSVIGYHANAFTGSSAASTTVNSFTPREKSEFSKVLASTLTSTIAKDGPKIKATFDSNGIPRRSSRPQQDYSSLVASNASLTEKSLTASAKPLSRRPVSITEDDYNFYYNLDPSKRKMIDKVVALRVVNEFAVKENHDLRKDKQYLEKLDTREKRSVKRLARFLDGDNMNDIKVNIVQEDLNYYDNLSNRKKDDINRLIVGDVFNFTEEHNIYGVKGTDQAVLSTLNPREKELFHLLHNIRSQTHNVFGNRLDLDKTILESETIIAEVKSYDNTEFDNITIEGSLFAIDGGKPLGEFALDLVDKNGNVIVSTRTNKSGEFSFKNIEANNNYSIQSSDGDVSSRAKDRYFIKNMQATGKDRKILATTYDEFFLNNDRLPFSITSSIDDISNFLTSDPENTVFVKVIDEDYQEAMQLTSQIIEALNKRGIPNTSIKYKRELPKVADNKFEGLFKNKIEFHLESNERVTGNNYYSFLVRKDTNIEALANELKIPEEVLIEENSFDSKRITKNSIVRVWRPLTDPSMDILVNVSDFDYQEYRVKYGESVITIAEKLRLPEELIMEVNNLTQPDLAQGQVIQIYVKN